MSTLTIVTGDYVSISIRLKKNGATFAISPDAEVKAAILTGTRDKILVGPVAQLNTTPGADWANSLVVLIFEPDDTVSMSTFGMLGLEVQVSEDGKPQTWFQSVNVIKGNIP